jgi:hypothetical protein
VNAVREPPIVQRCRLVERLGLLFQQRQIMKGVIDEIGRLISARTHGNRRIPADDLNPIGISLRQNFLMAAARRRRIIVLFLWRTSGNEEIRVLTLSQAS